MSYLLISLVLLLVLNLVIAYSFSRWQKDYYFYPEGAREAYRNKHYRYPPWKDGDVKVMSDWWWPHIIVSIIAVAWPVALPLTVFLAVFGAVIFGVYKAILWAAELGRNHVDKSNRSDQEV